MVELRNVDNEKYGRILAEVYLENENINQWLVDENMRFHMMVVKNIDQQVGVNIKLK
jgi:endonuclease YncB( thermonuclease family)